MSNSPKSKDKLLQRLNQRKPSTEESVDAGIQNKVSIISTITGSSEQTDEVIHGTLADGTTDKDSPAIPTSETKNPVEQVTLESDKSNVPDTSTSDMSKEQEIVASEIDKSMSEVEEPGPVEPKSPKETAPKQDNQTRPTTSTSLVNIVTDALHEVKRRKTKLDTHKKVTYELRRDLSDRFDAICKGQPRGFKEKVINKLLEQFLDEVETTRKKARK